MKMKNDKPESANTCFRPVQPSMKRRARFHDYSGQGAYMLTLVVEGRRPLLGRLRLGDEAAEHGKPDEAAERGKRRLGNGAAEHGKPDEAAEYGKQPPVLCGSVAQKPPCPRQPYIELSALGEKIVREEIRKISRYYPQVEVWRVCVMPDHIHMIVRVREDLPQGKNLGHVITGFKTGCNRAYYSDSEDKLGNGAAEHGKPNGAAEHGKPNGAAGHGKPNGAAEHGKPNEAAEHGKPNEAAEHGKPNEAAEHGKQPPVLCGSVAQKPSPRHGLFEPGYNDRLLFDGEQLERWKHYLDDNPRRLAIKRQHPDLFIVKRGMRIAGHDCQTVGNHFLLDIPDKVAVIVHRRYTEKEYKWLTEQWLACGERGGVLVSAAIAPKERAVLKEARERGYNIIWLNENGFSEFYKPTGKAFDACSAGRLLQVCPWEYHTEERTISREQCLELNAMATEIAGGE